MADRPTVLDLDALRRICATNAARIDAVRTFMGLADSARDPLHEPAPEELLILANELDDPGLLARPALLSWNTIMRERQPFDAGVQPRGA